VGLGAMDCEVIMDNQDGKAVLESTITLQLQLRSNQSDQAAASHG